LLASGKSANPQTFNRYVYVQNSPIISTDPTGLCGGPGDPCPETHSGSVYFRRENGVTVLNNVQPDSSWRRFRRTVTFDNNGVRTTVNSNGWFPTSQAGSQANGFSALKYFLSGFKEGYNDTITGARRGAANFGISTWNSLTNPLGSTGAVTGVPNPFAIEPYQYDNLRQARWGSGTEVGIGLGLAWAGGVFGGGGSSLSVVPEVGSTFESGAAFLLMALNFPNISGNLKNTDKQDLKNYKTGVLDIMEI
jgi:hypothetical protein